MHFQALRAVTRSQRVLRIRVLEDWRGYANRLLVGPFQVRGRERVRGESDVCVYMVREDSEEMGVNRERREWKGLK